MSRRLRRRAIAVAAAGGAALALGACARGAAGATSAPGAARDAWVESSLAGMTLRDKAAQLVWPQIFADYTPTSSASWRRIDDFVAREHVGGIIVSIGSPIEMAAKLNALQQRAPLPLVVGADLEGGAGFRARGGYFLPNGIYLGGATVFPPQMAFGATRDTALAYQLGRVTALEGRALGIHIAFAPVADVNNNPANPVIGPRSFGEDPRLVSAMVRNIVRGIEENGEIATPKHFPGHGDTDVNSHLALPTINATRARLDSVELPPFEGAIAAGAGAVMTFHGRIPALDTTPVPATLSPRIMTGLLRQELGFKGLLITDAMDMNGVLANVRVGAAAQTVQGNYGGTVNSIGIAEACKLAIAAGADVLLMPSDVPAAIDAVVAGVREGRFTEARIDESVRRILAMKRQLGLDRRRVVDLDSTRRVVGDSAHGALADAVAERSITLAKDSLRLVPLRRAAAPAAPAAQPTANGSVASAGAAPVQGATPSSGSSGAPGARVLSITLAGRNDLGAGATFNAELRRALGPLREVYLTPDDAPLMVSKLADLAGDSSDVVVFGSYLSGGSSVASLTAPGGLVDMVRAIQRRNPRLVVVAFGNPYLLQQIPDVPAYLVAWGGFPVSQRAAALALTGRAAITGQLPISIPPMLRYGAGERRDAVAP